MLNAKDSDEARDILRDVKIASIGPVTSKTVEESGLTVDMQPKEFTIPALVDVVKDFYTKD